MALSPVSTAGAGVERTGFLIRAPPLQENEAAVPVTGSQVSCPSCGVSFTVDQANIKGSPRESTGGGCGEMSKQPSRNLSSAFEMDDCAPDTAAGSTLTVSASAVGDWSCLENYPGSPCAPYPLVAAEAGPRPTDELAAAFVELRTGGRASLDDEAGSFVADDPRVHAEAQRRRVHDEQGFRFRRDVCVLLETSANTPEAALEPETEDDVLRPAELAW